MSIIAVFTTVDSNKFNINGYEVFKIFNSRKVGTNAVDIVNVYDNQQALFQSIRFDEISVDGIVYTNVEDLITNLTPLIYRPASLGNASQGQIDNIQTIIDSLPTTYAGINHDHEGLYLTEQQIRNLNLGGNAGESITSGNVLGNKIRFFNDLQQLVFEIDAKAFLSQGSLLSYNENTGRLTLSNGFAEVLSTQTIRAQNVGFDSFEYVEGIANDLSNLIVGSTFLLVQTLDGTFYFINPNQVELSEDFRLTFINNSLVNDLTVADVTTVDYDGYILTGVNSENYEAGETYLFTFWRKQIAQGLVVNNSDDVPEGTTNLYNKQADLEQTDVNAPDFVKNADVKQDKRTNVTVTKTNDTYTLQASDVDKRLFIPAPCTVIVPNGLAANLEFQGKQVGTGDVEFVAETGGTLNVNAAFQKFTEGENAYWGIVTLGSDVADLLGTLKLAV